ncbi:hypothetical protein A2U01_0083202, partial [Trifolium medium]|nr:hypothetical protein [Trifolium medium]
MDDATATEMVTEFAIAPNMAPIQILLGKKNETLSEFLASKVDSNRLQLLEDAYKEAID